MNAPEVRGLFAEATNTQARLKMGILGFAGSGKTFTSTSVAISSRPFDFDVAASAASWSLYSGVSITPPRRAPSPRRAGE